MKIVPALSLALVVALAATPAVAQSGATGSAPVAASAFTAQVSGDVVKVDHSSGLLTVTTADGQVNVKFPPAAVQTIKPGDHVTVAFGLVQEPAASPPSGGAGSGSGSGGSTR